MERYATHDNEVDLTPTLLYNGTMKHVSEEILQMYLVGKLIELQVAGANFIFAGDQNGGYRSPRGRQSAINSGIRAGEADVRLYFNGGLVVHLELKNFNGSLSQDQKKHHAALRAIGHTVIVLRAGTGEEMASNFMEIWNHGLRDGLRTEKGGDGGGSSEIGIPDTVGGSLGRVYGTWDGSVLRKGRAKAKG